GRQVRGHGGAVGRSADRAPRAHRRPRGACDVPGGPPGLRPVIPELQDLLDRLYVVALPMRVRFRGITTRELALIDGPAGGGGGGGSSAPSSNTGRPRPRTGSPRQSRPPTLSRRARCAIASRSMPPCPPSPPPRCPRCWPGSPAPVPPR